MQSPMPTFGAHLIHALESLMLFISSIMLVRCSLFEARMPKLSAHWRVLVHRLQLTLDWASPPLSCAHQEALVHPFGAY